MSFLNPSRVIEEISLSGVANIVDLGSGSGGWSIPLAKKNKDGMVYAVDVLSDSLSALKSKSESEKVYNIRTVSADIEKGTKLMSNFFDLAVVSNILFQAEDKDAVIREAHRVLKTKGKMIIVDWKNKEEVSETEVDEKAKENGFQVVKKIDAGVSHFANLYEKV